jgi:hypothetical protein
VRHLKAGERRGVLEFKAQADGIERVYGYRVLENYPFYVLAGLSEQDVMAAWRRRIVFVALLGSLLFVSLVAVVVGLYRSQRREHAVAQDLLRNDERLNSAQRIAQLGSWEIELPSMNVRCSAELFRIFELPDSLRPAAKYDDFMARVHPEDQENTHKVLMDRSPPVSRPR